MKLNRFFLTLCAVLNVCMAWGQQTPLRFNKDGKFKIVQLTDIHYKYDDQANSQVGIDCINKVLDAENPDCVIITGDGVVSNESFKGWDIVLDLCISRNIPYAVVFGNHDDEYDHTRQELYDYIAKKKGSLMPQGLVQPLAADYVLTVKSAKDKNKDAALLYCIDSHSYTQVHSVPGYDWIKFDQIAWYRNQSKAFTEKNGGTPLPALAFFHIATPEFKDALMEDKNRVFGCKGEMVCCPTTNSGFFTSVKECGDVMGIFVGHDHDNDYAVAYKEVLLAYGRYSGGNTVYNDLNPNGARVIILKEGERTIDTYIRLANNEIESAVSFPKSFY